MIKVKNDIFFKISWLLLHFVCFCLHFSDIHARVTVAPREKRDSSNFLQEREQHYSSIRSRIVKVLKSPSHKDMIDLTLREPVPWDVDRFSSLKCHINSTEMKSESSSVHCTSINNIDANNVQILSGHSMQTHLQ